MITLLVIIGLFLLLFRRTLINMKERAIIQLDIIYDKMELYVAANNLVVDNKLKSYLIGFKTVKVNPEFADLQVLFGLARMIPHDKLMELKEKNEKIVSELPKELTQLGDAFNKKVNFLISLSVINTRLWLFLIKMICKYTLISFIKRSFIEVVRFKTTVKEIKDNDMIIVGSAHCAA